MVPPPTVSGLMSPPVSEWLRMSAPVTVPFLMLLPVITRAYAEPPSDITSAVNATTMAGDGSKRRKSRAIEISPSCMDGRYAKPAYYVKVSERLADYLHHDSAL